MFEVLMVCFAVVLAAAALGVALLATSGYAVDRNQFSAWMKTCDARIEALVRESAKRSPETLAAAVDDLRAALDVSRASNRKEFGSLWGRLGGRRPTDGAIGLGAHQIDERDGAFDALLDLQSRPPAGH